MKKTTLLFIFFLLIGSLLVGCAEKKDSSKDDGKFTIYTTVYPLQYFTERIAGDLVTVESIYPPGADEHTFEPSQKDMMNLADADLFIYVGLGLEGFVDKAQSTLKNEGVEFLPIGEQLEIGTNGTNEDAEHHDEETEHQDEEAENHDEETEHQDEEAENHDEGEEHHDHGDIDPHVWLDPIYAKELALAIKNKLIEKMPEEKQKLEENFQLLVKDFDALDASFESTVSKAKHKEIIVSHAAFGYWEERYGLQQISISGLSSTTEPSQKELEEIVKLAKDKNLKYILFEQNVTSKLGEIIQEEIGAKSLPLHNLSTLTDENIQNEESYFTLMEKNIQSLSTALNE